MWRRFEFKSGKSHKFWEIHESEGELRVIYGRLGSQGSRKRKFYRDVEKRKTDAEKRIAEKLTKGYKEVNAARGRFENTGAPPKKIPNIKVPAKLDPYRAQIEGSLIQCVKIRPGKERGLKPWNSKVAGHPYLPAGHAYPKNKKGPLTLLAQINFEEMPPLRDFPTEGILQFYIDARDTLLGKDSKESPGQDGFRVLYFPKVEKNVAHLQQDFQWMDEEWLGDYSPVSSEIGMRFREETMFIGERDYRFMELFDPTLELEFHMNYEKAWDAMKKSFYKTDHQRTHHQIGGYPHFTQSDPRETPVWDYKPELGEHEVLLFQLNSGGGMGAEWGDWGIGNFFIKRSDLLKRDFSRVLYNWDCN